MKKLLLCLLGGTLGLTAFSQDFKTPNWSIESATLYGGTTHSMAEQATIGDFRVIAPESAFAKRDFTGFSADGGDAFRAEASGLRATFVKTNWKSTNRKLRLAIRAGLSNATITPLNVTYTRNTTARFNEYVSGTNGEVITIDTTQTDVYKMAYHTKISTLDIGLQLNTNYLARWSAYAGIVGKIGLSYGTAEIKQKVTTEYFAVEDVNRPYDIGRTRKESKDDEQTGSSFRVAYGFSIPIGIQYRLSKTHKFFNRARVLLEFQPCLAGQHIEGFGMTATLYSTRTFGIQFDI